MTIKYFEVKVECLDSPVYYTAYTLDDAKAVTGYTFSNQSVKLKEIELSAIPLDRVIQSAKLNREDAKALADRTVALGLDIIEHGINA